jgi:sugar lactone lactonase YvrE
VEWKSGATSGNVVAGGNGQGNRTDQLNGPVDIIVAKESDLIIICDRDNRRVVCWPRRNGIRGETIMSDIACRGLTMDDNGFLYVSDPENNEVRRFRIGDTRGTIVAGGNGGGNRLDQLNLPTYLFIDHEYSVYVSDRNNHRVVKWMKDAKEGIVVAGGRGKGNTLEQLSSPYGLTVNHLGNVYVADSENHRIMRWSKGAKQGTVIAGGNGQGTGPNQLDRPSGLSFDRHGNLYVVDYGNSRIQRFDIDRRSNI